MGVGPVLDHQLNHKETIDQWIYHGFQVYNKIEN